MEDKKELAEEKAEEKVSDEKFSETVDEEKTEQAEKTSEAQVEEKEEEAKEENAEAVTEEATPEPKAEAEAETGSENKEAADSAVSENKNNQEVITLSNRLNEATSKLSKLEKELAAANKRISEKEELMFKSEVESFIAEAKHDGKVGHILPAQESLIRDFMLSLDKNKVLSFKESGDKVQDVSQIEMFKKIVKSLKQVDFSVQSKDSSIDADGTQLDDLDARAKHIVEQSQKSGKVMLYREALIQAARVMEGEGKDFSDDSWRKDLIVQKGGEQ